MKVTIHPTALYRVPLFPLNATLEQSWEELKKAIALSSTEFHKIIEHTTAEQIHDLPQKVQHTIWKYFNRAKHRCTPYATFANVGLCQIQSRPENPVMTLAEKTTIHSFIDWSHKDEITTSLEQLEEQDLFLFSNSSFYLIPGAIRYISHLDGAFQLSDIDQNELALKILEHCTKPLRYSILSQILKAQGIPTPSVLDMVAELVDLQLLITSNHPNILGEDYFKRINVSTDIFSKRYLISERKLRSGYLDSAQFRDIPDAVNLLQKLLPNKIPEPLAQFINQFRAKFESQPVPLMVALDPELGVGYGNFESIEGSDTLVTRFARRKNIIQTETKEEFKHQILAEIIRNNKNTGTVIQLENLGLSEKNKFMSLPNSFSAMVTVSNEHTCIDSIGNCSANALLGRFSLVDTEFSQNCKNIADLEQKANPEVAFFDVAYISENSVDNLNRRRAIYPLQLTILNYDTSKDPLVLDDIFIFLQKDELILYSKKMNKRLIPRFTSAYNYQRSDLSLFRLLCDLQHQRIQTNFDLNLPSLYPNASYYPRIQYKKIIISPARWQISYAGFEKSKNSSNEISSLRDYLDNLRVSRFFKAGFFDQTLLYDMEELQDLEVFLSVLRKQNTLYVSEAFNPAPSLVRNQKGEEYQCQLVLSLTHNEQVYKNYQIMIKDVENPSIQRNIAPGTEWLYFEIFCHIQRTDEILLGAINNLLDGNANKIDKWFFIRYNDNGDHIRLRIELKNPRQGAELTMELTKLLDEEIKSGIVSELSLKTYKREIHRYGWSTIEPIERHFTVDSNYILSLLTTMTADQQKYVLCVNLILDIKDSDVLSHEEFDYITSRASDSFNEEHQLSTEDFKELNSFYKLFKNVQTPILDDWQLQCRNELLHSFIEVLTLFPTHERRTTLIDLFHMHVNRLFTNNQRSHEMIIYYFIRKEIQRNEALKKQLHLQNNTL